MSSLLAQLREALAPQYEVESELGSGGMGSVFLARDPKLDRLVAIKVLRPDLVSETATERFDREVKILAHLKHPNIVPLYQAGDSDGLSYYVMQFVEGESLAERLERGPLPREQVRQLADNLLSALAAAHENGIIHRDVKPSNVFLVGNRALLADFGIAKRVEESGERLTASGVRIGTLAYMPPEQLFGDEVTPATDVYAAAMLLYEALTGRHWSPLTQTDEADWSSTPLDLERALRRALAWSPKDRWENAAAFRVAIAAGADHAHLLAEPRVSRKRYSGALGLGVLAIVAVMVSQTAPRLEAGGFSLITYAGAWLSVIAGVWFLFDKADEVASPEIRGAVARWLRNLDPAGMLQSWPRTFARVFDRVFSERHLSWKCLRRSCVASLAGVTVLTFVWLALPSQESPAIDKIYLAASYNLVPDYLSLLETRYMLRLMSTKPTLSRNLGILGIDAIATAAIFLGPLLLFQVAYDVFIFRHLDLAEVVQSWSSFVVPSGAERGKISVSVFFYSTFFTSLWLWLYALAGAALKAGGYMGLWVGGFKSVIDLDDQPLRSLGFVTMVIVTLFFLLALPLAAS